jgi:hypothetical protein
MTDTAAGQGVERRRVFYIPGYDPFPPRRYRELYRREGAAQAALSGHAITLEAGRGPEEWHVTAEIEGAVTRTRFEVLVWSDLVRASMGHGLVATYGQLLRTVWIYVASGALGRLMRLRKGPVIAALYPVVMLMGQLALALALAWLAGGLLARVLPQPWPLAAAGVVPAVLALFRRWDGRLYAHYLMHDYAHAAGARGAYPPELAARLSDFADRIGAALDEGADEVLVVGHSSGAHLAVSALAELLRDRRGGNAAPALSLLTLGQVVPMVSFLPEARRLRADLNELAQSDRIAWVDVTAPGDGCAFALCDPVAVSGVAPAGKRWPLVVSAAFTRTLSPERWRALRWRFFRLHFQYLCAFDNLPDRIDAYDYFRITAGPITLAARFAGRAPSQSRIEAALSPHSSMAA